MKLSAQILLLLALFGLLSLSFAQKVTVTKTKSFSTSKYYSSSGKCDNTDGSDNEETETPPINPGADSYNACDPNNRPQACTKEYAPVCGYIHECEGGACTSTFGNECTACADSSVDGYVKGACEDAQTTCDPDNRPEVCTLIYTATCAVAADCQGSHCFQDTSSSCVACSWEGVAYSLPGVCPGKDDNDDRTYCDANNRPDVCTADYTPVCAHKSNCVGDACWSTAGNACSACASDNIDYHVPGECSDDDEEDDSDRTYCDADNRPEVCTLEYNPVCAHTSGCTGDNCWNTAGNACGACGDSNVDYHVPGECPNDDTDDDDRTTCDADNRPEICTLEYNPVCAHTSGCTGDDCWNTAGNACGACSDTNVDYHVPGECPDNGNNNEEETNQNGEEDDTNGDGRTECDADNRPEVCTLEYAPVCAHIIGCEGEGDDCFRTEGNGCGACSLDDVDYYTTGEC